MTHKNSRTVTVFRAGSFLSRAQGKDVEEFLSTTKKSIGSYWESTSSKRIGSGLNTDEEELLLPHLVDATADDRDFRAKVKTFYIDLDTPVPHSIGRTLEIGLLDSNDKQLSKTNMPINIMDYLRYRHIIKHPHVAMSKEDADGNQLKEFYVFDKSAVIKKNTLKADEKDSAIQIYLEIKSDMTKVDSMLTLMEIDPREFEGPDAEELKVAALRELSDTKASEFVTAYKAADLSIRYWIKTMVNTNVLKIIGSKYLDGETNKLVGNNLEETIFFFKDEDNSEFVTLYKARMQEALTKKPKLRKKQTA